ncbi:hypothetical protein TRFO_31538 [Tritrichomonas foetus]|uniref:Glucosidase 2 subunit beta n=1 Tax=Tritrichomonas foetus TaxID=1144522 RepID=A0A1J4JRA2_9EUKA|nr:hypothetical protein TRFO_31538 [Tritrichomonas foetus]|eukprot:OHT01563.1 hypothetical protein TRFO_31538 [Tritrichomonas foetus]
MILFSFFLIFLKAFQIRGVPPNLESKYTSSIDSKAQTFRCFDNSKTISLSKLNDNVVDCADGSDEPGTSAYESNKFYCQNDGFEPILIDSWKVDDGVCDCCDCSDEPSELASKVLKSPEFRNLSCDFKKQRKSDLVSKFKQIYNQGLKIYEKYSEEGEIRYNLDIYKKAKIDHKISILEKMREKVIDRLPYDNLGDPDDFPSFENWIPPAKTLEYENEFQNDFRNNYEDYEFNYDEFRDDYYYGNNNDEDDYDRYYGHYDRYDRYNYYENPQDYRNDYTYEYIPPPTEPTPFPEENHQNDFNNDNDNNNNNNYNNNDNNNANNDDYDGGYQNYVDSNYYGSVGESQDVKEKELSGFKKLIKYIWNFTFLFPEIIEIYQYRNSNSQPPNNHYNDYGYHPWDPETTEKVNAIDEQLNPARSESFSLNTIANLDQSIDKAFVHLIGKDFKHGEYTLNFLREFKKEWDYLGSFTNVTDNTMIYGDGSFCYRSKHGKSQSKSTIIDLQCWNKDKLVRVTRMNECEYRAVFATPLGCKDAQTRLQNMTLEELEKLNNVMVNA